MASTRLIVLAFLATALCLQGASATLKIAAFNIQTFGTSKMSKPHVVDYLVEILARYDMTLIQEIRNKDGTAIVQLLNELNAYSTEQYDMIISERLGRSSSYMEQYCYFYKVDKMSVVDSFLYPDNGDRFEREPFVVQFSSSFTTVGTFAVAGIHVKPDDAVSEIDLLADVYDYTVSYWSDSNVAIMGDFNAGCNYVKASDWSSIRLRTQTRFVWHIGDDADTNVSTNTACPYDRIVTSGQTLPQNTANPGVFNFDTYFGLDYYEATEISDHYPVHIDFV